MAKPCIYSISLVIALCITLSTAAHALTNHPADKDEGLDAVTLQLKWKHQFQFAGYYAAIEQGFYREAGLHVTIVEATAGEESTSRVISGEADFGIAMCDLVLLRAKGKPVVALAAIFQHSPSIILAPKANGIENIHDLMGKKIALEAHSEQLLSYLESEGLPAERFVTCPHDYDISKLISGEVDAMSAYSTDEPFMLAQRGMDYSTFSPRAAGIDFYGDILFTSEDQLRKHPARVAAFVDASLRGWEYALSNTDEVIDLILSKYSSRHSREHLLFEAQETERLIMPEVVELGYMNPGRWVHIADSFKQMDHIPADFSLRGFVYDRNPTPDLRWLYLGLSGAIAIAGLASILVAMFYRINKALQREIQQHQVSIEKLKQANDQIKTLRGIIPICMYCKGVRDDEGYWNQLELYIAEHADVQFSHGICEKCMKMYYPEIPDDDSDEA